GLNGDVRSLARNDHGRLLLQRNQGLARGAPIQQEQRHRQKSQHNFTLGHCTLPQPSWSMLISEDGHSGQKRAPGSPVWEGAVGTWPEPSPHTASDRGRMMRNPELGLFGVKLTYHARC